MSMGTLGRLASMAGGQMDVAYSEVCVRGVGTDTRGDLSGQLFVALRGPSFDGHNHLASALAGGAVAAMVEQGVEGPAGLPLVQVADSRRALMLLAGEWRSLEPLERPAPKTYSRIFVERSCRPSQAHAPSIMTSASR